MILSNTDYQDLLGRAELIGLEAVAKFSRMAAQGENADKILRALLDMVAPIGGKEPYKSLSQVPDDLFIRTLTDPKDQL
jgi:hypothetical protein